MGGEVCSRIWNFRDTSFYNFDQGNMKEKEYSLQYSSLV